MTAAMAAFSLATVVTLEGAGGVHGNDFKHLWGGAGLLARGQSPYEVETLVRLALAQGWVDGAGNAMVQPFVYLPTTGLLAAPLAMMRYETAQIAWLGLNWALAWSMVLWLPGWLRLERRWAARLALAAFLAGGMPFLRQTTAGQMNVVTAVLVGLAAGGIIRRKNVEAGGGEGEALAGAALAVGFAWKVAPALLIAALAAMGKWRAALWGATVAAALLTVSIGVYGWEAHAQGFAVMGEMNYGGSTWAEMGRDFYRDPFNQSVNSLMHHLMTENPYTRPWISAGEGAANLATWGVTILLGIAWLAGAVRARRVKSITITITTHDSRHTNDSKSELRGGELEIFLAAGVLMLLAPSLMWDHYAVQLMPAIAWMFGSRAIRGAGSAAAAVAILAALMVPWNPHGEGMRDGAGVLVMSLRLWPTLAVFGWLMGGGFFTQNRKTAALCIPNT